MCHGWSVDLSQYRCDLLALLQGTPDVVCDSLPHDAGSEPDLLTSDDDDDDSDYSLPEEPRLPFADQLLYTHQPLTAGIIQQLQEDLEQPVNYHGRQQFNDALNLEVFGDNGLARSNALAAHVLCLHLQSQGCNVIELVNNCFMSDCSCSDQAV